MQRTALPCGRTQLRAGARHPQPFTSARPSHGAICHAAAARNGNGNGAHAANGSGAPIPIPTAAQTIRTLVDIVNEGTLCTVGANGQPVGIPVTFATDKQGHLQLHLDRVVIEKANLQASPSCSLVVQPISQPARAVAAVTLMGQLDMSGDADTAPLNVESCIYYGGLDQGDY
ncbi:hypothetical protein TSOC_003334 [Tetrabaena socialis]|uniref:Pyridoxamine 5'-phosphate oxidase putative domain-containing protein n=1 Tax=Tetrabaena socialis TaxID=47790 RepID=A0A2J8ABV5_9CHLO|nr:hypothetical protein TSOC_003334 [Tetrabaena socialis]|eukprot:PNH09996.1 hypothetical protein TSOC_003334 [Tetrabaena socialis]